MICLIVIHSVGRVQSIAQPLVLLFLLASRVVERKAASIFTTFCLVTSVPPVVNCISVNGIGEGILKDISRRFKGKYKNIEPAKL